MKRSLFRVALGALLAVSSGIAPRITAQSAVSAPVLMWQYGGCLSGPSCQTGWYSSPAVADLDGDGRPEVIWGAADVVALNGANGSLKWRGSSPSRIWSGVAVADLTGDGTPEVIVGRDADQLTAYNRLGGVIWTRNPFGGAGELRALAVTDFEQNGQLEIVAGEAAGVSSRQVNVLSPSGTARSGWPARRDGEPGDGGGLWNADVAVADMNGDGLKEVFAANGSHYINAFDRSGNQLAVNSIFAPSRFWSEVGVAVDNDAELRGWVNCGVEHRPDFSQSAPAIADVNGDGVPELIVVGSVRNCGTTPYTDLYQMPFIFKLDRTRWSGSGFDWTAIPTPGPGSAPRSTNYNVIEDLMPNAVVADLDGDGFKEVLFPSYDGKLHAYWLDKTEHGNWPYTVQTSGASGDEFRFGGEPVVADLNNDGHAEVIFTSWPRKASGRRGQLIILDYRGTVLYRLDLPASANGATWNGGMGAPTIANIDSDSDLELVVGTVGSGVIAYKLPNTATAGVLWGTGRGDYGRTGTATATVAPPPDTTPPAIAITAPAGGATVIGTTTVTANASDNVGIAGVQFLVDGVALGAEVTLPPYSRTWDTTTVPNGSHTLTALARDAVGNTTTSATVNVTVSNPPIITSFSPTSGAVGTTVTISGTNFSGATAVRFNGTSASFTVNSSTSITGTVPGGAATGSISVTTSGGTATSASSFTVTASGPTITSFSPSSGAVGTTVSISGTNFTGATAVRFNGTSASFTVNSSTSITTTVPGGATTGPISVTTSGGTATSASSFTVTVTSTVTRVEETGITFAGPWSTVGDSQTGVTSSNGTVMASDVATATATLTFTGTGISWIGFACEFCGIANVYLVAGTMPGTTPVATVDTFAATRPSTTRALWTSPALADGTYTVRIEVTTSKSAASSGTFAAVDAFDVTSGAGPPPPDTTPPTVSVAAPASGSTVSGSVTVGATASDNVGVGSVQMFLDGGPLGTEDTTAPYALAWNTTTVVDGAHTLTARARDTAGNTTMSASVTVTISNAMPPTLPTATRFEDTELSVTYTPGTTAPGQPRDWFFGSRSRDWSDGTAAFNRSAGARATFAFTGTAVSWIGFRAYWAGIASVYLDGAIVAEVDLFLPPCGEPRPAGCVDEDAQAAAFTRTGLTNGPHTLTIESTGRKHGGATCTGGPDCAFDYAVVVDAFDVAPAAPPSATGTRTEETPTPAMIYTAGWASDTTRAWSGGTARVSSTAGARATFNFSGTEIRWVGLRGPGTGIANVYLDGAFQARIDTYARTEIQTLVYTITGLAPARHTVAVEATGQRNAQATGSLIAVDAFDVRARLEERDPAVVYAGTWTREDMSHNWSGTSPNTGGGSAAVSATAGAVADVTFTGAAVTWIGFRGPLAGIADVFLDGSLVRTVDLYAAAEDLRVPVFTATGLSATTHTLRIAVTGNRNPAAGAAFVVLDAFDVMVAPSAPQVARTQQTDAAVTYTGGWTPQSSPNNLYSGQTIAFTTTTGARATFTFTGSAVRWVGQRSRDAGIARVLIDGTVVGDIDLFVPVQDEFQATVFSTTALPPGTHTVIIEATGMKRGGDSCTPAPGPSPPPCSAGYLVVIDAFDTY